MTKEQLKNILIENKYIASDEWSDENPFVCIDLDTLYGILEKEKQQWIEKVVIFLNERVCTEMSIPEIHNMIVDFRKSME